MKLKYWVWKIATLLLFIVSFIFLVLQFEANTNYYYLYNSGLCLALISFILVMKPKWDLFISFCCIMLLSFYTWGQSVYFRSFGQYAYINTALSLKNEAIKSFSSILEFIKWNDLIYVIFPLVFIIILVLFRKIEIKLQDSIKILLLTLIPTIILSVIFIQMSFSLIESTRNAENDFFYYKTDHYLFYSKPSSILFVEKFGLNLWLFKDIYDVYFYPLINKSDLKADEITNYLNNINIDKTSPFNGVFEGKSLLLIEAESLNNYAIDPILTPTLYQIYANGYRFPNYNSPLLLGSTSDAELMVNTGLLPPENGYVTFLKYFENTFPTTLANEFNEENYYSMASHNNYGEFYNRDVIYPNLGYTFFDCIDMGFDTQFIEDSKYIEVLTWILIEKPQFFSFWITFNGHQPYNVDELPKSMSSYLAIVKKEFPDIPSSEQVFLAKNMDLDRGLAYLIDVFTYLNRIDDLVIIIYGDHAPKGIFEEGIIGSKDCSSLGYTNKQCLNTPLIVWNNDEFVGESLKVANPTDISPTIYDLFGIDYNQSHVFGNSVFSDKDPGFYFDANGNIQTSQSTFNSSTNQIIDLENSNKYEFSSLLSLYNEKMKIYRDIIEINYFSK